LLPPRTGGEQNGQLARYTDIGALRTPCQQPLPCVTPKYLAKFLPAEIAKWAGPIKATGVSMD
jgi:hypothetical protein